MRDDVKRAAASGGLSGAILGGGSALISGMGLKKALRNALIGGLGSGALAGTGVGVGGALLGDPEEGEINPNTRRAALGGGLVGGAAGAGAGLALSKGIGKAIPAIGKHEIARFLSKRNPALAAALGLGAGALVGGFHGGDEGMQVDFLQNERDAIEKKRRAEKLAADIMAGRYHGEGET